MSRKVQGYLPCYWVLGSFGILGVATLSPASLNEPTLRLHACLGAIGCTVASHICSASLHRITRPTRSFYQDSSWDKRGVM